MFALLKLGLIGFGEAGYYLTSGFAPGTVEVSAYDSIAQQESPRGEKLREHARQNGVTLVHTLEELVEGREIVFCLTSAGSAVSLGEAVAPLMQTGQVYLDMNSTSPTTKESIGALFQESAGDFVEAAVMTSVPANGTKVPIYVCGEKGREVAARLNQTGMNVKFLGEKLGTASATKMLKSVLAKGMIALLTETVFCTQKYGITETILQSLKQVMTEEMTYEEFCHYCVCSAATHNERFCHEMEQVLETMDAIEENSIMTQATLKKFQWLSEQKYGAHFGERPRSYDQVLAVKAVIDGETKAI